LVFFRIVLMRSIEASVSARSTLNAGTRRKV